MNELFDYYQDILPDGYDPEGVIKQALPTCLWVNTLKISKSDFYDLLTEAGFTLESIDWHPAAFRYSGEYSIAKHWSYAAGLFHIQEEVSMLSGFLLAAKPGDCVLDLCAAPGNKTAQLAVSMKNEGTVIANDINYGRMRALGQISKRLGLVNITTHTGCAASFPNVGEYFDKIMVDAPCSCEGTVRKRIHRQMSPSSVYQSKKMASRQRDILLKAFQLCKPGGVIMYSTCTFSPIENEQVVQEAIALARSSIRLVPLLVPGLMTSAGVSSWQGVSFNTELQACMRLWPWQNNTGGFFLAMMIKEGSSNQKPIAHRALKEINCDVFNAHVGQRFGLDEGLLKKYALVFPSKKGIFATNREHSLPDGLSVDASGLFCLKMNMQFPKLSTAFAMVIGKLAKRYVLTLTKEQRVAYLSKQDIELIDAQVGADWTTGYVIIQCEGYTLGLGLYFSPNPDHGPVLRSLFRASLT